MPIRFYNTLTRTEENFQPLDPAGKQVLLYCCGPTVYNFAHIGNFRSFSFEDLLRRHLEFRGHDVRHVMNVTDVEDKIIRSIHENGESLTAFTRRYEQSFLEDLDTLGCLRPKITPRATEHIPDIIELIRKLEQKGLAYKAGDGSVYYSIEKFSNYGRLARLDRAALKPGARVSADEHGAESYGDFALWKAWQEKDGAVVWESPWGRGRPGWHIECSCMSMKHLGETLDIHCGGEDLIFPHHEDEIAQSEGASGKPFVRYWLHCAHLMVNGEKMSKSAGNFFTIRDLLSKGWSGRELKYNLLSAHYRLPFNFTLDGLEATRKTLRRVDTWAGRLAEKSGTGKSLPAGKLLQDFAAALDDDLNISKALGILHDGIHESNKMLDEGKCDAAAAAQHLSDWKNMERILGLPAVAAGAAPEDVMALAREREKARQGKDWKRSDELRTAIQVKGWVIKDSPGGFKLTPS